ncbi:hypothetical protein ACFFK0_04460 [Paenibacillus chartarius]|uniref:Uncharacterized protein n=1 Tax=Paenibacillus chartarius TaxID=747481 RepID=A0ABV6DGE2_9BACL
MIWKSLAVAAVLSALSFMDARRLISSRNRREAYVYGGLMFLAFVLFELYVFRVPVTGPNEMLMYMARWLGLP